jgi:K+-transporting ATPase ATPase C chain
MGHEQPNLDKLSVRLRQERARVARARGGSLSGGRLRQLVAEHTQARTFGFLGEPRVNVLLLNRALDGK